MLKFVGILFDVTPWFSILLLPTVPYLLSEIFASLGRFSYLKSQIATIYLVLICTGGHFVRGVQYRNHNSCTSNSLHILQCK
jgi:hypothetical protein